MQTARRFLFFPALVLAASFSASLFAQKTADDTAAVAESETLPLDELRTFTEVFTKIKNDFVEEIDDRQLIENAIRGMLEGLDPHSAYLDKAAYEELQEGTSGEFGGLGIEVGMEDGFIKVIAPIDDTPAKRAGVQSGDLIIRLNDTPVKGMSLSEAVQTMRGEPGTTITLHLLPEDRDEGLSDYTDEWVLRRIVKRYSDFVAYPIRLTIVEPAPETELPPRCCG